MKEFSNKTPYLAPQLTVVEFRMERGFSASDEPEIPTLGTMEIGMASGLDMRMGDQMTTLGVGNGGGNYFGYTTGEGSSGFITDGSYF
jgi:hypothetical protein